MSNALPMYQRQGKSAFKKDLSNTIAFCKHLGHPEKQFKSIHVAGTNGKGSTSHMLAAMLQNAGFKVGLYTSPHLKDFRERVRISGSPITEQAVIDFIESNQSFIQQVKPSFFEMTVALAFDTFASEKVDIAIIEVGLGGRLDSTNVITPELSVITNIGYDHMDMLGDTLAQIAGEKAGIIKQGVPVVVGEYHIETAPVFEQKAQERNSSLLYAKDALNTKLDQWPTDLRGAYQYNNKRTALATIETLHALPHWDFDQTKAFKGLSHVVELTGLKGRWQTLSKEPLVLCDTGHNQEAFDYILPSLEELEKEKLWMVLGFVNDKNVADLLRRLPKEANYIFTQANIPRAMQLFDLKELTSIAGIQGEFISDVNEAIHYAKEHASENDVIFVGGSTFVVAEIEGL